MHEPGKTYVCASFAKDTRHSVGYASVCKCRILKLCRSSGQAQFVTRKVDMKSNQAVYICPIMTNVKSTIVQDTSAVSCV